MRTLRWFAAAGAVAALAACDRGPTTPATTLDSMQASLDAVDPVVVTFDATQGLPGGPFGERGGAPFMGGMPFGGGPMGAMDDRGPGAPLPDSLKLTDAQKAQIQSLIAAFVTANAADIATLKAAHVAARDAIRSGATRDSVRAILDAAKPAADRLGAAADALHTAIAAVLTDAQRAWIAAHKPDRPPRTP